jgi:hypothetical protein
MSVSYLVCTFFSENKQAQDLLAGWGLRMDSSTVDLMARVLAPETIIFGNSVHHKGSAQAEWGAAVTRSKVLTAVSFITELVHR